MRLIILNIQTNLTHYPTLNLVITVKNEWVRIQTDFFIKNILCFGISFLSDFRKRIRRFHLWNGSFLSLLDFLQRFCRSFIVFGVFKFVDVVSVVVVVDVVFVVVESVDRLLRVSATRLVSVQRRAAVRMSVEMDVRALNLELRFKIIVFDENNWTWK